MHEWENVGTAKRLSVPGGWIYEVICEAYSTVVIHHIFIPNPTLTANDLAALAKTECR